MATYKVYKHGEYVAEGTFDELAEITGRSRHTLVNIRTKGSKIWEIVKVEDFYDYGIVDNGKILFNMGDSSHREMADLLMMSRSSFASKINEHARWSKKEIEELEDLFFLEEGELLND